MISAMRSRCPAVVMGVLLSCGSPASPVPTPPARGRSATGSIPADLTAAEKIYGLSLFWKEASYNFAYFDQVPDVDWDAAYRAALERVTATANDLEYYRELQRFCALLEDGHTNVYLPERLAALLDSPPISLDEIEGRVVIDNVAASLADRIPPGSVLTHVDGVAVDELLGNQVIPFVSADPGMRRRLAIWGWDDTGPMTGPAGTRAAVTLIAPDGQTRTVEVARDRSTQSITWAVDTAPPAPLVVSWLEGGIALIAINSFVPSEIVDMFAARFGELERANGIVIDLRSNGGGNGGTAARIVGLLTSRRYRSSAWRTRRHVAAYRAWGRFADEDPSLEQYRPYADGAVWLDEPGHIWSPPPGRKLTAPIVVLTSGRTASAAEDFLVMLDSVRRALVVGEPTHGSTGQPLLLALPGGGSGRVCTKRDVFPDGREFVGYGIQPHVRVDRTLEALRSGRDEVLERGLQLLRDHIAAGRRAPPIPELPNPRPASGM